MFQGNRHLLSSDPTGQTQGLLRRKVVSIVALFVVIGICLILVLYLQSSILNEVRSYVLAESLWAKAQKDAVANLHSYAWTGEEHYYQQYLKRLGVPLGDKSARLALQQEHPDERQAYLGFLEGENHPDDIPGMIEFFRHFQSFPYMSEAIDIWTRADGRIEELIVLGGQVFKSLRDNNRAELQTALNRLNGLNKELAGLEKAFSRVLSEGSRWIKNLILLAVLVTLALLSIPIIFFTRRTVAQISQTEKELRISENRFRSLFEYDILGIIDWHGDGHVYDANDNFLKMLGYSRQDVVEGRLNWRGITPPEGWERDDQALAEIARTGYSQPFEKEFFHKDGHRVPVLVGAAILEGTDDRGIAFTIDHTERRLAETQLQLAATVFDSATEGLMITDRNLTIIDVNKAMCDMFGYKRHQLVARRPNVLGSGLMSEDFYREIKDVLKTQSQWLGEIQNRKADGSILPVRVSISAVKDGGDVTHYVATYTDISDQKATEEKLNDLAHHDHLTGLPNRKLFLELFEQEIKRASRNNDMLWLLFLDLDGFKAVNDTLGHEHGDELLRQVAKRLQENMRESDLVARLGGDEFVILLSTGKNSTNVDKVASSLIGSISAGYTLKQQKPAFVTASIGIANYPQDGTETVDLMRYADQAMYAAKSEGKNRFHYFTPAIQHAAFVRSQLANDLRRAIDNDELMLFYQPIADLKTGRFCKAEALIRWQHAEIGMISPASFIPIAEETAVIHEIGTWVVEQAIRQLTSWMKVDETFQLSINISPLQLNASRENYEKWFDHLRNISGNNIVLEITEGAFLQKSPTVLERFLEFRDNRIKVAMDDFGTGYSSLAYLKEFDIDYLKIDQTFIRNLARDSDDETLVEAIVVMARKMGMLTVAEGVETQEQLQILQDIGCDFAQGFVLSKPLPAKEYERSMLGKSLY